MTTTSRPNLLPNGRASQFVAVVHMFEVKILRLGYTIEYRECLQSASVKGFLMIEFFSMNFQISCFFIALLAFASGQVSEATASREALDFFEKSVRPLLIEHCYSCHSAKAEKLQAGLRVDSRAALLKGGESGQAIVPGDVEKSLLIGSVRYESYEMPPKGKLPAEDIEILERWVAMDAPWPTQEEPGDPATEADSSRPQFDLQKRKSEHWAWQPVKSPKIPEVSNKSWPRGEIDHFILARLEQANLIPASDAEKSALLRRLYFDLIGLPPTWEQAKQFLDDSSPQATERLVDELLASPRFGERWGRHWLDLVRYAESRGHEFDNDTPNAFQYRDYVIRALNADVPYDLFVTEHIAGDLIEHPRLNPEKGFNESILGTGFWFLGEWVHSPVDTRKDESDRFDNMIDVMSKTFLGVTVACARCHDHKFDAISTADYYSLSGFLQGSDYRQVPFESLEHNLAVFNALAALDESYQRKISDKLAESGLKFPMVEPIAEPLPPSVIFDYSKIGPDEYIQDGFIFGKKPRSVGVPYLETVDGVMTLCIASRVTAASDPFWNGIEAINGKGTQDKSALSNIPRSGRTLRTPSFVLTDGMVACRIRGAGHVVACVDSHRLIAGPLHGETIKPIRTGEDWVELNLRRYEGHRVHLEFTPEVGSQLEISVVTDGAAQEVRDQLIRQELATESMVNQVVDSSKEMVIEKCHELVSSWAQDRAQLQSQVMMRSQLAMAMMDGTSEDDHVLIRGNSSKPGKIEPRHFLTAIAGDHPMQIKSGSGRLELARQINSPTNPLKNRVIVNRIWHHLMGRGIVPTTDDFGVLGQRPTNFELLDYLATRFCIEGQSIKQAIRDIVLSRTYQMSSQTKSATMEADPKNQLWHYRPPKRLEGEAIRDEILMLSGQMNLTPFGESVPIHLTAFMDGRGRPAESGPLDGAGRRSIYLAVRRNFLPPFMLTFDTPSPFSAMGRRNVSNVPAQALILMNDPFVVEQSKKWAERIVAVPATVDSRIDEMYRAAFSRHPTELEMKVALNFLVDSSDSSEPHDVPLPLWADFAHALINTKEFIFLP